MINRAYLLVYDRPAHFDAQKLRVFIDAQPGITDWWHFLESAHILISFQDLDPLTHTFRQHFNGISYLVLPVSLAKTAGMLPQPAWDWINSRKGRVAT